MALSSRQYRPSYRAVLDSLPEAAAIANAASVDDLRRAFASIAGLRVAMVGSGGTYAIALLACDLAHEYLGCHAVAVTPLQLQEVVGPTIDAVMVFSARARNPDVRYALEYAKGRARARYLITNRGEAGPRLRNVDAKVVDLPSPPLRDGFLATQAVLMTAIQLVRATGVVEVVRMDTPTTERPPLLDRTTIIVGPGLRPVAFDLEARLSETGLSAPQVTDYRNFGHGRHYGFSRHRGSTTLLALVDPRSKSIADETLKVLPDGDVRRFESRHPWPQSAIDLLVQSMHAISATADLQQLDPANPRVTPYGRRLYHLRASQPLSKADRSVRMKLGAAGLPDDPRFSKWFERKRQLWIRGFQALTCHSLVLDYDGTVCDTERRYDPPSQAVQRGITRLLRADWQVCFASGRGASMAESLRAWIPARFHSRVVVVTHNGARALELSDTSRADEAVSHDLQRLAEVLRRSPLSSDLEIRTSGAQLSLRSGDGGRINAGVAQPLVRDIAAGLGGSPLRVIASGHSIDVVAATTSKTRALLSLGPRSPVIAIGDQGQFGGNDFDLLAATPWSLSVDLCSADPSRCWNLLPDGVAGTEGLVYYLRQLGARR